MSKSRQCDLLIIGGGPAGLSAAINGASEGLNIILMDSGPQLGGQAAKSSLIENYPGFPEGITGNDLIGRYIEQAKKFKTVVECPQTAIGLRADGMDRIVTTDEEDMIVAKMVILSAGLSYRRLAAPGIGHLMGRGVLYGAPTFDPRSMGSCEICIVGGANSAGQAAMHMSRNPTAKIRLLIRKKIEDQMSTYLVERIREAPNVEICEGVEVIGVDGKQSLEEVVISRIADGSEERLTANHLFIFIGASPKTLWLNGSVAMNERKFILTGIDLKEDWKLERPPLGFETSMPGVFACGDVRFGSTKRIASAVGEGSVALQSCHDYARTLGI